MVSVMVKGSNARQNRSFFGTSSCSGHCRNFSVIDVRVTERADPKGVCVSLLRNEAVLRDVGKAE